MLSDSISARNALQMAIVGENAAEVLAKAIDDPQNLSTKELIVLQNLQMANFIHRFRNERIIEIGYGRIMDDQTLSNATVYEHLGNPFGLAWWRETSGYPGPWRDAAPRTAKAIEAELAGLGDTHAGYDRSKLEAFRTRISNLIETN